jgi:hypothetical protein
MVNGRRWTQRPGWTIDDKAVIIAPRLFQLMDSIADVGWFGKV